MASRSGPCDEPLGAALRHLRAARGLSLAQVARLVDVSKGTVAGWEAERHRPGVSTLARLLDALGADPGTRAALLLRVDADAAHDHLGLDHLGPPVNAGTVLRGLRYRRGITQARAAESVGVGQSAWAKWEAGEVLPPEETLDRALDALGASDGEKIALRSVVGPTAGESRGLDALDARIVEVEHARPIETREILLLGIEAEAWRRAAWREAGAEAILCRAVAARAQQCLIRGDLREIEPLARRAVALAASSGETAGATAAVSASEWIRQRTPGGAVGSARRLGAWVRRAGSPNHRYWLVAAQAQAVARTGEPFRAVEMLERLDAEEGDSPEAVFHRSGRAAALLAGDEPERARESLQALGEEASPLVAAKVALALGEEPDVRILDAARRLAEIHWLNRTEFERIERALVGVRRGRKPRFP